MNSSYQTQVISLTSTTSKERFPLEIKYTEQDNLICVKGRSLGTNLKEKYSQLLTDINSHLLAHRRLSLHFAYAKFDLSTLESFYGILKVLKQQVSEGKMVKIIWYTSQYDTEMREIGNSFSELCMHYDLEFKIKLV
ncbi:MAG: SiaC family regulatory phosphoprotein [Cyclobacteriaceae bacterium]